jgi:probable HAF family extracellular repeat protein
MVDVRRMNKTSIVVVIVLAGAAQGQQASFEWLGEAQHLCDINDRGQVVAEIWTEGRFRIGRYSDAIGWEFLDPWFAQTSYIPHIAETGQVSFTSSIGGEPVAFRYTDGIGLQSLDTAGYGWTMAAGINDAGDVPVLAQTPGGQRVAVFRDGSGLQLVPSAPLGMSSPSAINNSGMISGTWEPAGNAFAVRYVPGVGMQDLGSLGFPRSVSIAMNNSGDVIGWSSESNLESRFFLYTDQNGITALPLGTMEASLEDINDSRWIVGSRNFSAVLWTPASGLIDLDAMLPVGTEGHLRAAIAVNNRGQILGTGWLNGQAGLFRVTVHQLPSPGAFVMFAFAAIAHGRRR